MLTLIVYRLGVVEIKRLNKMITTKKLQDIIYYIHSEHVKAPKDSIRDIINKSLDSEGVEFHLGLKGNIKKSVKITD